MILSVHMGNTKPEERDSTLLFLKDCEAYEINMEKEGYNGTDEYTFQMAVDTDEDMINALKVMLYYNDRSSGAIATLSSLFARMLELPGCGRDTK